MGIIFPGNQQFISLARSKFAGDVTFKAGMVLLVMKDSKTLKLQIWE